MTFILAGICLLQHDELFLHHHVLVVVPEEQALESAELSNLIKEVRQGIPIEQSVAEFVLNTTWTAEINTIVMEKLS